MSSGNSRFRRKPKSRPLAGLNPEQVVGELGRRCTTPKSIDSTVRAFCQEVVPGATPVYVQVKPAPWAKIKECHLNVRHPDAPGRPIYGFNIWYMPGFSLEAVYHSVCEVEPGQLLDITPQEDGEARILFVPTGYTPAPGIQQMYREIDNGKPLKELVVTVPNRFRLIGSMRSLIRQVKGE